MPLDFNKAPKLPSTGDAHARYDRDAILASLRLTANSWVPALFPQGKIDRVKKELRVADITGRAPRNQGSCVINLEGEHAGGYTDFGINDRGHDAVATIADHYRVTGIDALKAAAEVAEQYGSYRVGGHTGGGAKPKRTASDDDDRIEAHKREAAFELGRSVLAAGTLVETYFASRGLTLPPTDDLKFGDNVTHWETKTGKPALLAVIRSPDGRPTGGIHRIYLKDDGSGHIGKMMLGPADGVVMLAIPDLDGGELGIAEGIETAAAAMQQTGVPCWSTLSAGGMRKFGDWLVANLGVIEISRLIIFADRGQAGEDAAAYLQAKATAAGLASEVKLPTGGDDFADDLAKGLGAPQPEPERPEAPDPLARSYMSFSDFRMSEKGLFAITEVEGKDGHIKEVQTKIASEFEVIAQTRDNRGNAWGRLLRWRDSDNRRHEWAMPLEALAGTRDGLWREFLGQGLWIPVNRTLRDKLAEYLSSVNPRDRARAVSRIGWHAEGTEPIFVLPDSTYPTLLNTRVLLQSETVPNTKYGTSGTLDGWRDGVARRCVGNSRLTLGVSAAFAAPLLRIASESGGGVHYDGSSQCGKTTILLCAGSVWGGGSLGGFLDSWRTTSNGLESVAEAHCDALLCLDELGQVEAREAGEVAYMLANGSGKLRAKRDGSSRPPTQWLLLFLSSGELSLAAKMAEIGKQPRGGQEVRLIDIKAEPSKGHGAFEELHGAKNVGDFCNQLRVALSRNYGHPIRAFLDRLSIDLCGNNANVFIEQLRGAIGSFMSTYCPNDASGQVRSVCRRFGLIAAAGELASLFGLTGWPGGESTRAAVTCFRDWLGQRGTSGDHDIEVGIRQVIAFIEAHGASRFETVWEANSERVINRAGFRKRDFIRVGDDPDIGLGSSAPGSWQYMVLPEAWRAEVCRGYDPAVIAREMANRKMLEPGNDGKISRVVTVPGNGSTRLYVLAKNLIGGA